MLEKLKAQWKKEWIAKNRESLELELGESRKDFDKFAEKVEEGHEKQKKILELKTLELNFMIESSDKRMEELHKKDNELRQQIKLIEAKASPDRVWTEAFSLGFSKAWDMIEKVQIDGLLRARKKIEDEAINKTIGK